MNSAHIGIFSLAYNIALGSACIAAGYVSGVHRPRWIAIGLALMSVGAVIVILPKFIMRQYEPHGGSEAEFCSPKDASVSIDTARDVSSSVYVIVFTIGFIVHGIGSPAVWTLVPARRYRRPAAE